MNLGSIGSLIGIPWEAWYHASKFAVLGVSESLRNEVYAQGVRVSVVCPGGIDTPFIAKSGTGAVAALDGMSADRLALYGRGIRSIAALTSQVGRLGSRPERVAGAIVSVVARQEPPFRILVGLDAHVLNTMRQALPERWFQAALRRAFGC